MKPADRALNIVVVGLGQAGGNLASEFARLGYRSIALNTAHTDLSSLASADRATSLSSDQRIYIGIDGYDGAGADMNYGRECIRENAERIREVVIRHSEGADVVIITAGLGGGTGSSVSELVTVLSALDLPMIVLATLPNEYESGIAKVNAVRAVSDLVKHENIGWIFADNSRLSTQHGGVSLDKYFEKVNSVIIRPLDELNRLNNRKGIHPIRSLDGEDFRALLLSNGVMNYSEGALQVLTVDSVLERVRESLQQSSMMPHGFSPEEVAYMGIVLEAGEDVLRGTPFSFFEQLNEKLKHETGGAAIYMGVYRLDAPVEGGSARLRLIASTQSLPEGVQAMVNDARREGGTLRDKLQRSISSLDLGEIEDFDLFKTTLRTGHGQHASRRRPGKPNLSIPDTATGIRRGSERVGRGSPSSPAASPAPEADADPDPARPRLSSVRPSIPLASASARTPSFIPVQPTPSTPPNEPAPSSAAAPEPVAALSMEATGTASLPVSDSVGAALESVGPTSAAESTRTVPSSEPAPAVPSWKAPERDDSRADDDEPTREFQMDSIIAPPPSVDAVPQNEWTGVRYVPGTEQYNGLDAHRQAEAASYQKLVATFLRTEFDSTKRRVARRLDAARRAEDALSRDLAHTALDRLNEEGQLSAFEAILQDGSSVSL
jgi:cell division GTPase FtsZ